MTSLDAPKIVLIHPLRETVTSTGSYAAKLGPLLVPGTVRVEVYSPDGDVAIHVDASCGAPLRDGERWGQDNLVDGSHPGVEEAAAMAHPSLQDFRWQHNACYATYPELAAWEAEYVAAEAALRRLLSKRSSLLGMRLINALDAGGSL